MSQIKVFYDEKWYAPTNTVNVNGDSLLHSPPYEILSGRVSQWFGMPPPPQPPVFHGVGYVGVSMLIVRGLESPSRVKSIKKHLERFPDVFPFAAAEEGKDFGMAPILKVHDTGYVNYLQTIYDEWYYSSAFVMWELEAQSVIFA